MLARIKARYRRLASGEAEVYSPVQLDAADENVDWDVAGDVVIIGFGGAGAAAAIEASDGGAQVVVLDRFAGGGSTRISGGIYYAGGGTRIQREAGVQDTPENMFNYLRQETGDAVREDTLRRFCAQSPENFAWLEEQGVPFDASTCPYKTSYPSNLYYFYYSGNESFPPYSDHAAPAPRGHRAHSPGVSGAAFFGPLEESARRRGVEILGQHKAVRLISAGDGTVLGVEAQAMRPGTVSAWLHRSLAALMVFLRYATIFAPFLNYLMRAAVQQLESRCGVRIRVQARRGVVISSGGYYYNRNMMEQFAPRYLSGVPLGTIADDGSGVQLGASVGGVTGLMDSISAWRFINPPQAFVHGILVDAKGERICNEMLYGAQLARRIMERADGRAWLIIDRALFKQALTEIGPRRAMWFQSVTALMFLFAARTRRDSLEELSAKLGMPAMALRRTVEAYNHQATSGAADTLGKPAEFFTPLGRGPYYALNCCADSLQACPTLSLGGLCVDEDSGEVLDAHGGRIRGLYAAGRSAVGVASRSYVSGLSIADCIFSGRRAGSHAAQRTGIRE